MTTMTEERAATEPGRARALFSTADFRLLRAALASHARVTEDREDLAQFLSKTLPSGLGVLSTVRDDRADSTLYVPTAPEPSGYPFPWLDTDAPLAD